MKPHDNTEEPTVARAWPLCKLVDGKPMWTPIGSGGAHYEPDARLEALWRAGQRMEQLEMDLAA